MPRDFRPKGHGAASRKREKEPVPNKEKEARYDDEGVSEDVLRPVSYTHLRAHET